MPLFLTEQENTALVSARAGEPARPFYWALLNRVARRSASAGLSGPADTVEWWHLAFEYISDAAMAHALCPSPPVAAWLRAAVLSIARRPADDWVGPPFRDHSQNPPAGNLETAHLAWAVAIALDLAPGVFNDAERGELAAVLRERALPLCSRWLDANNHLANWRCVMAAGTAVAAAVLDDAEGLARARGEFPRCVDVFQPDGSYGESLQYADYAARALMLSREALVRRAPALHGTLPLAPYAKKVRWDAASLFYLKPLDGWGAHPRPRSANFNDSAALYRPSADVLLHIAARARDALPAEAGLARWLFDTLYEPCTGQGPHDRASFGFVNDFGFLTLPLLTQAAAPLPPEQAGVPLTAGFSCGDVLVRDAWNGGRTTLAIRGAGDPLHAAGHLHGDLNSMILVHNRERLLLDPGHSCYRNVFRGLDVSSATHNTCTFETADGRVLGQSHELRRGFDPQTGVSAAPVSRGGRRELVAREDEVSVVISEAAALYGAPLTAFTRIWISCGAHVLFVVDRIAAGEPVRVTWNWLLNNRDGLLDLKIIRPDRLVARRGNAGMKLFHVAGGGMANPIHALVHDAYHPLPGRQGEGRPGSGRLVRWTEKNAPASRTAIHAICLDEPGAVAGWHMKSGGFFAELESPHVSRCAPQRWRLALSAEGGRLVLSESVSKREYNIARAGGAWRFARNNFHPNPQP
jgi:hypothetical protein